MNLIKSILKSVLFIMIVAITIQAEDPIAKSLNNVTEAINSQEGKLSFMHAVVLINGEVHVAHTQHEYNVLKETSELCNQIKKAQAEDRLSEKDAEKTASLLKVLGVKSN